MPEPAPPLPRDGIYRSILMVMAASVVLGAVVALLGELVWHDKGVSRLGTWVVLVSGAIYFFFRFLGRRRARREAERARRGGPGGQGAWNDWDERDE